ncbi:hypothetical protein PWG71_13145, partial [Nocardiopsis sp. N85]|uniref:hypothetical protein n=1 Tax=Nocardiopsis sp. N85 TaxID=3029400 RepID=UPI003771771A|nr:hypothetical protein [Nocardiopsis sp. N85]
MTDNGGGRDSGGDASWFRPSEDRHLRQSEYEDPLEGPEQEETVFPDSGGYAGLSSSRPALVDPYPEALGGPPVEPPNPLSYPGAGDAAYRPLTRIPGERDEPRTREIPALRPDDEPLWTGSDHSEAGREDPRDGVPASSVSDSPWTSDISSSTAGERVGLGGDDVPPRSDPAWGSDPSDLASGWGADETSPRADADPDPDASGAAVAAEPWDTGEAPYGGERGAHGAFPGAVDSPWTSEPPALADEHDGPGIERAWDTAAPAAGGWEADAEPRPIVGDAPWESERSARLDERGGSGVEDAPTSGWGAESTSSRADAAWDTGVDPRPAGEPARDADVAGGYGDPLRSGEGDGSGVPVRDAG